MSKPTVAVIGAGAAELVTCKALGDRAIPTVCFETSDDVGGTWYFRNPNGRSAAYRSLHLNISHPSISFRDHPLLAGHPKRYGLPTPNHRFLESDPTMSGELLLRLGSGDVTAKPNVTELRGDAVRFDDGSEEEFDVIVYATGYRVSFPFFDEEFISAPGNVLPLYKRIFKPGIDDLAFIGLAEPLPSQFIFAELQAKLVSMWLDGEWAPPSVSEMEAAIVADERRFTGHFTPRARHTMQHLVPIYERDLTKKVIPAGRRRAAREG